MAGTPSALTRMYKFSQGTDSSLLQCHLGAIEQHLHLLVEEDFTSPAKHQWTVRQDNATDLRKVVATPCLVEATNPVMTRPLGHATISLDRRNPFMFSNEVSQSISGPGEEDSV